MKQTSLLDSFIKKQQNKNQSAIKADNPQNIPNNEQPQPILHFRKSKFNIDSDEEAEEISSVRNHIEDMEVDDENYNGNEKKKSGKKVNKSANKNKKEKDQKVNNNNRREDDDPLAQFTDATPIWAQKQYCKDKMLRTPSDPHYDPSTLHVPNQAWEKFTAPMRQFWRVKSDNYDKVILFKLGKFYQMFYDDAAIGNKYLDLKYMGTKMHTGFPEKCLQKYAKQLVQLGFKTVIVEQMQTPEQMENRIKEDKRSGRKSQKTLNRQITQILTKGTFNNKEQSQSIYLPNYLMSLRVFGEVYAFSLLQIGTNEIIMDTVDDLQKFKTVLYQTRPVELVYDPDNISFQLCRMMEKTFLQMQMSKLLNKNNIWHPLNALGEIDRLQKQGIIKKPKIFEIIESMPEINKNLLYSTLSGLFDYLKKVFKFEYVISSIRFTFYQKDNHSKNMILDSQALQHLQIFQTSQGAYGSLFSIIDRTKTKFGKRLLRKWVMSPLMNQFHINQRLNAVQDIENVRLEKQKICSLLKKLPDLDRKINKLYHYAIKTTSASKAVYFEDINTAKLKEFKDTMEKMEEAWGAISILKNCSKNFKSMRLKQLLTVGNSVKINEEDVYAEDEDDQSNFPGLLPDIMANLQEFKSYIKWANGIPIPQKGLVAQFDQLQTEVENIKDQLQKFIEKMRYQMNQPNLKFAHTKERYEIEVPQKSDKRRPQDFEFSSKRAGFSRYVCPQVKKIVKNLEKLEEDVKEQMGLFIGFFFEEFKKKQKIWQRFVDIVAEIDCLISLSQYSFLNKKVRPNFVKHGFEIKAARHPCLINIQFIPNDVIMNRKVMLLTGPNMGGKSTILRTVCCLAVLAQIGCYVPADEYNCETIDRIFTRIGASDKLQLGKSTFFIQMQQTKSVLQHGTNKSLAIIDQLGRGTSTFDGLAIAYAVLRNIVQKIRCYCLFATHYHILIDEFRNMPQVQLMMMDSLLKQDHIIFLYKLVPGSVARSFGLSVASRVGIQKQTIKVAEIQAEKMNNYIEGKRKKALDQVIKFLKEVD